MAKGEHGEVSRKHLLGRSWIVRTLQSGSRRGRGVLSCPPEGVVCDLLPAVLSYGVVGAPREHLVVCHRLGVAVVLGVRLVDSRRHEVVLASRYEQERRPVLVPEVDVGVLVAGREVSCYPSPHEVARRGYVVALVDLV